MARMRTRCPGCGQQVELDTGRCALLGGPDGRPVAYAFVCPDCDEPVVRRADRTAAALLEFGGASQAVAEAPVVPRHPEEPAPGPPLTPDDLIDFHLLLQRRGWHERLLRPSGGRPR